MTKTKAKPLSLEVYGAVRALKNKRKAVTVKSSGTGLPVVKLTKRHATTVNGVVRAARHMPPEYYLLSKSGRLSARTRLTPRVLYFVMSYLTAGVHWKGRIPETDYWIMEMGLRLVVQLRDSDELKKNERYQQLLDLFNRAGGYSWTPTARGEYRAPRQPGWATHGQRVQELSQKGTPNASGALYWPSTWEVPACPECGSPRCIDMFTNVYYCWQRQCLKSRWNTARNGKEIASFAQAKDSLGKGRNILNNAPRKRSEPESALVGQQLVELLQHSGGEKALALLRNKRL